MLLQGQQLPLAVIMHRLLALRKISREIFRKIFTKKFVTSFHCLEYQLLGCVCVKFFYNRKQCCKS